MEKLGVWGQIKDRVVQGESVGQAFQFVASGNVELGFVALAQLKSQDAVPAGSLWLVPEELHGPLHQDALLLRGGETNSAAIALMRYLKEPRARAIMREHGYS
jgi:molybdate transport system substrate-binding protein